MADYGDPTASAPAPPTLDDRYQALIAQGIPAVVARSMVYDPSYAEGQNPYSGWPTPYAGQDQEARSREKAPDRSAPTRHQLTSVPFYQDITYQPGAKGMAGGWNQDGGAPGMGGGLTPDMIKRIQMYQMLMQNRGTAGMPGAQQNALAGPGGAPGTTQNLIAMLQGGQGQMPPQMLMQWMQWLQSQQEPGRFPQGGGGADLSPGGFPQGVGNTVLSPMMQTPGVWTR